MPNIIRDGQVHAHSPTPYHHEYDIERAVVFDEDFLSWLSRNFHDLQDYVESLAEDRSVLFESWEVLS